MPAARSRPQDEPSRPATTAASARKGKQNVTSHPVNDISSNSSNKDPVAPTNEASLSNGVAWNEAPLENLNTYRMAYNLNTPAAFTTPWRQAILTNPGIGRQSPTMARRIDKRRVPRDQLATAVRKNFNSAAVNEMDVVVELVYKVRHQDKTFRLRNSSASMTKK